MQCGQWHSRSGCKYNKVLVEAVLKPLSPHAHLGAQLAARPAAPAAVAHAAPLVEFRCQDMRAACDDASLLSEATVVYLMNQVDTCG